MGSSDRNRKAAGASLPKSFAYLIGRYQDGQFDQAARINTSDLLHRAGLNLCSLVQRLNTSEAALELVAERVLADPDAEGLPEVVEQAADYARGNTEALFELCPRLLVLLDRAAQGLPPEPALPSPEAAETASEPEAFTSEDLSALTDELRDVEALLQAAAGCDELADARRFAEMAKAKAQHVREVLA